MGQTKGIALFWRGSICFLSDLKNYHRGLSRWVPGEALLCTCACAITGWILRASIHQPDGSLCKLRRFYKSTVTLPFIECFYVGKVGKYVPASIRCHGSCFMQKYLIAVAAERTTLFPPYWWNLPEIGREFRFRKFCPVIIIGFIFFWQMVFEGVAV